MKAGDAKGRNSRDGASIKQELPVLAFATKGAWEAWLVTHHASSGGVWLKIAKSGSNSASITYAEALDVALAWGWIDGQKGKFDNAWWLQRFTRRGPRSVWSNINRKKAESMIAAGKMKQPGLAEIERAKSDGRWEAAYESQSKASVPPDLAAALKLNSRAARFFETLDSRNRYSVLFRIHTAKKPETRALRIEKFVTMLSRHQKLHE